MLTGQFQKSKHCESGGCVEVAQRDGVPTGIGVVTRPAAGGGRYVSAGPGTPELHFYRNEWAAFVRGARAGQFQPC
ncbi:MAG TPA: DUF397 domain-containing protein [Micromonosporaceae bacterium]|nr:DUF397 domain-containing protein [Micromonosporaceae bacterium]